MNTIQSKKTIYQDLGTLSYQEGLNYQTTIFEKVVQQKLDNRKRTDNDQTPLITSNHLLFCEHPHVYTLGKSGDPSHLLINQDALNQKKAEFYKTNRGGDITYHGPGQIVGYPILDLDNFFTDIHKYLRFIEEAIIKTLEDYGIQAGRIEKLTGVWVDYQQPLLARKICAIGVRTSRWVTMHGFAFNVNTDLSYFENIVPCGISDKAVTSLEKELGKTQDINQVKERLKHHLATLFEIEFI